MWTQVLGAGLVMGTAAWLGYRLAGRLLGRPRQLRALQTGLSVLQTEIEWGAIPLPEALRSAAQAAEGPSGSLLRQVADAIQKGGGTAPGEALRSALVAVGPDTCLSPEDLAILGALAPTLGATGRTDQIRHLALARERLAGAEALARAEAERYERLARWGPVLIGAAIVLVLI
jgi:stage III sporulation protein AB